MQEVILPKTRDPNSGTMQDESTRPRDALQSHFDEHPYPFSAADRPLSAGADAALRLHGMTPFLSRNGSDPGPAPERILDVGCGTGLKTMWMARANPRSTILGIDQSPKSIEIARSRGAHHGARNVEFQCRSIESLAHERERFDLIHCDEVLYLLDDPAAALKTIAALLRPMGMIACSFHNHAQRMWQLAAQRMLRYLGIADMSAQASVQGARRLFSAMHPASPLRQFAWGPKFERNSEALFSNQLLPNDHGFTLQAVFDLLRECGLHHAGMADEIQWTPLAFFPDPSKVEDLLLRVPWGTDRYYLLVDALGYRDRLYSIYASKAPVSPRDRIVGRFDLRTEDLRDLLDPPDSGLSLRPGLDVPDLERVLNDAETSGRLRLGSQLPGFAGQLHKDSITVLILLRQGRRTFLNLVASWSALRPVSPWSLQRRDAGATQDELLRALKPLLVAGLVVATRIPGRRA